MTNSPEFPDSSVVKECSTTDLVMRLRSENSMPPYYGVPKLQVEAAAEIEKLRAEAAERELIISDLTMWVVKFMEHVPHSVAVAASGYLWRKNLPTPLRAALAQEGDR